MTSSETKIGRKHWTMLGVIATGLFLTNCLSLMLGPLLVEMAEEFDTSVAVTGQLAAVTFAAWGVSVVLMGPVSDSFGRRPVALMGLTLLSTAVLASAFAPNYGVLFGLRIVTGLGGGMIPPNSMATVADSMPDSARGKVVSWLYAVTTLAYVLGIPAVVGLAAAGGWRLPFLVLGGASFAVLALAWRWFPNAKAAGGTGFSFFARYRQLMNLPAFRLVMLANVTHRMAFFAVLGYVAAYLIETYGIGVGQTALPMAVVGLGAVVGSFLAGLIAGRNGRLKAVFLCVLAGGAAAAGMFAMDQTVWTSVGLAFVATVFLSVPWPTFITLSTELAGNSRATGVGLLGFTNQTGGVGGAAIGGAVLALSGFAMVGVFCVAAAVVSAAVIRAGLWRLR